MALHSKPSEVGRRGISHPSTLRLLVRSRNECSRPFDYSQETIDMLTAFMHPYSSVQPNP